MEKTALSKSGKMLASDFDRTFYVNCKITEANTRAVETWRQQGNLFVIATGREESILREKLEEWEAEADYLICNNGARIVSWDGRVLYEKIMDTVEVLQITDYLLEQYGMPVDVTCKSLPETGHHRNRPGEGSHHVQRHPRDHHTGRLPESLSGSPASPCAFF